MSIKKIILSAALGREILFQNSVCIVLNKLAGEDMENAARDEGFIEAVHRLDVPVTGCALFALDKDALVFLNTAFAKTHVNKLYWAIVEKPATIIPKSGKLTHYIEVNSKINKSFAYNEDAKGRKKSSLLYKITGEGDNYLFMEIKLLSGRHHQIRAQLAANGLRIKGDLKYGAKRSEKNGGIRLHARSLTFPNPLNKSENITVTAQPPQMDNLWQVFVETQAQR